MDYVVIVSLIDVSEQLEELIVTLERIDQPIDNIVCFLVAFLLLFYGFGELLLAANDNLSKLAIVI